ncbi:MAG: glycosyltransferase [Fimbriimonadales bacterium]
MMKRILFVTTGLAYGGAETQLKHLAIRLKHRGWEVAVASMLPPAAYADLLESEGIPVYNLHMRQKVPDPRAIIRLAAIVRRMQPAIVHAYMVHANLLARVCRLVNPMPVLICSARSINEGGYWREWAYRITDPLCDLTTQVCRAGAERYVQRRMTPAHKMLYIPNGIDTHSFAPDPAARATLRAQMELESTFVWFTVGRLEPPKDYANLLQAFQQVVSQTSLPTRLLIVGQGPLQEAMERQIADLGLGGFVQLLGMRTDIASLLNTADAFVLASAWEGMSNALLEAAATALPVVATSVGGNPEIVLDGQTGYLVPPRNPDALADAMLRLMNLPEHERQAMGQAGRQHIVENFEIERIVDRWEQLYLELLERKNLLQRDRA